METGVFLLGGVEMTDAGAGPPVSTDRRYDNETVWHTSERMLDMGVKAERRTLSFWLTESHFHTKVRGLPNALRRSILAGTPGYDRRPFQHRPSIPVRLAGFRDSENPPRTRDPGGARMCRTQRAWERRRTSTTPTRPKPIT